ncbi:MAG TPA: branched-chain amino acid ABC transporter permease [Anaerolineae bacterium]|nr:MAG: leucine/isoleucine/valine transporter permease subunit [Chloroflexi bacterium ADurb.Bin222]HOC21224.1 branched-chain amino acid ABC transporter permease [Anaerolineae bacterium]HQM13946.1 branched-chain amino acid ABC transporter permease [Anaerolineae bacterium]
MKNIKKSTLTFFGAMLAIYIIVQLLLSLGVLNNFWRGIIFWGAAISIVALGLNLIYGFNGQFSLGQYGFYALGAYAAADVTWRWLNEDPSGIVVGFLGSAVVLGLYALVAVFLRRFYNVRVTTRFLAYLLTTVLGYGIAVIGLRPLLEPLLLTVLNALPPAVTQQIVFFLALVSGAAIAGIASFLFGIPVLSLGSDYFGIATLGFTIIVKVLLDNTDTILPFPEMKGARGMVGIPQWTTWTWVFLCFLLVVVVMRNLLHSSTGRAILSVREDERAAELVGIDVTQAKLLPFVVGSVFAGLAGGIRAHDLAFLHPQSFNFIQSFNPLIIVVFGGLGSMTGTMITGFLWILLLEGALRLFLPQGFETWRFVVYPLVLLIMMLLRPEGLFGQYEFPYLKRPLANLRTRSASPQAGEAAASEEVTP